MDVQVGDVIQTKKPHPCGANRFDVLRVGMDFKIKCQGCGHVIMLPRAKIERNIKKVLRAIIISCKSLFQMSIPIPHVGYVVLEGEILLDVRSCIHYSLPSRLAYREGKTG